MIRLIAKSILLVLACIVASHAFGQQAKVSFDLKSDSFTEFVTSVESQTDFRFYFRHEWTDSLVIQLRVTNESLPSVLDRVFDSTDLHYNIYGQKIYVTKERQLITELPVDYFNEGASSGRQTVAFDYSEFERKENRRKRNEEKLYVIGVRTSNLEGKATLSGNITDSKSGEAIVGASVFIEAPLVGVSTDPFGHFSLTLPKGRHLLKIRSIGMKDGQRQIMLYSNGRLDIEIEEDVIPLKEVLVESERDVRVAGVQMGAEKLEIKTIKQMPLVLGETDVIKAVMTLPGVQSVGEGTVGLNVRGGATSQNLILFNDAVVFNPSHFFGFFSTFNPDIVKNVDLLKSGITADYGGRLSSVLDVNAREGNLKKFSASGGISPVTGRVTIEGPLIKDKASYLVGVRSTYSDWLLKKLTYKGLDKSSASFYDVTASLGYKVNDNNSIAFAGYISKDQFRLGSDTTYTYGDQNASLKWKHVFSPKFFGALTGSVSQYDYSINSEKNPVNAFKMDFSVKQWNAKADFNYLVNNQSNFNMGASVVRYTLSPGNYQPNGSESIVKPDILQEEQGVESALYADNNYEINSRLSVYAGIRYSFYTYLGPKDVNQYANGAPRQEGTVIDTVTYGAGDAIANYGGLEPRVSVRYMLPGNASVKISYNRMRQYIQMLSNTVAITPVDIWKLSDTYVKPQLGDQISAGFYKNFRGNTIETSVEGYYKSIQNTVDYKNGAVLLLNHHLETDILNAEGKAYGIEFMIRKATGKVNGWLTYTYSRSFIRTQGDFSSETVNNGDYYPSNYDKPHAVNFIGNYKFSRRFSFSLNVVYSTGRPITYPAATYPAEGIPRIFYLDRNQNRIPDYFRTDISFNLEGNHKIRKLAHSSWTFGVYNLTGRQNVYSIYFVSQKGVIQGYKLSVFGQPIPTITYNFKF